MVGTIIALMIAGFIFFHPFYEDNIPYLNGLALLGFFISIPLLIIHWILLAFAMSPLQKSEQNLTPRLFEMIKKDSLLWLIRTWIGIFPLLSFFLAFDLLTFHVLPVKVLIAIWVVLLGLSIDALHHLLKKIMGYLNPFAVIKIFTQKAKTSIQDEREIELYDCIDALSEISTKSIQRASPSLGNEAIDEMKVLVKNFLESSKSISHHQQDSETKALGISDKVSFTLFYVFQRLELINEKAVENKLETTCGHLISVLGKMAIYSAKLDLTLTPYALHYIGKLSLYAQAHNLSEIGVKASLTLLEVAKVIINEIDLTYADLKDTFVSLINQLGAIAKETFKKDKRVNLKIITQPLRDLKESFSLPKVANHQDTPFIIQNIDKVLSEFDTLETVLRTIPPLPNLTEETRG